MLVGVNEGSVYFWRRTIPPASKKKVVRPSSASVIRPCSFSKKHATTPINAKTIEAAPQNAP